MSATFELIAPADAAASMFVYETTFTTLSTTACGDATFASVGSAVTLVFDSFIPSGVKIFSRTSVSHDLPVAAAAASPAARYIRLLYP